MNTRELEKVDQALFGYSDGHRQIAASIRLPSKDMYNLGAASDLASGAKLGPEDSYLTGLPLAESRRYALIRTWPAPEMPRPGCVWSHVVLIDFRLLSSYGDLTDFLGLFKRPKDATPNSYGAPISVGLSHVPRIAPDHQSVIELIRTYYSGSPVLLDSEVERTALEAAIMAVWSQQWPRLRMSFSFRTAAGGKRRKSELINYDVQAGTRAAATNQDDGTAEFGQRGWVAAGAADAATSKVTPLRRFLWRYGRDLSAPRKHYRMLVELFLETDGQSGLPANKAIQIFNAIPEADDGEILKRDILGIGTASPALCPPIELTGLLQLLASDHLGTPPTEDELRRRFASVPARQVGSLASYADEHAAALSRWDSVIETGLIASADRDALIGELPARIRKLILMSRPDLIDGDTIAGLSDDGLLELAAQHAGDEISRTLAQAIVRRDFGTSNGQLFTSMPAVIFEACVEAQGQRELNSAWIQVIADNSNAILATDWQARLRGTAELAIGLSLLRFPRNSGRTSEVWANALSFMQDDASGEDRVRLQAYLLSTALQKTASASWTLVRSVLPELRPVILRGALPDDVYQMLVNDLPRFRSTAYWDLDRRVLLTLSRLKQSFPDDHGALRALDLSGDALDTVLYGADEEEERSKRRFWSWF